MKKKFQKLVGVITAAAMTANMVISSIPIVGAEPVPEVENPGVVGNNPRVFDTGASDYPTEKITDSRTIDGITYYGAGSNTDTGNSTAAKGKTHIDFPGVTFNYPIREKGAGKTMTAKTATGCFELSAQAGEQILIYALTDKDDTTRTDLQIYKKNTDDTYTLNTTFENIPNRKSASPGKYEYEVLETNNYRIGGSASANWYYVAVLPASKPQPNPVENLRAHYYLEGADTVALSWKSSGSEVEDAEITHYEVDVFEADEEDDVDHDGHKDKLLETIKSTDAPKTFASNPTLVNYEITENDYHVMEISGLTAEKSQRFVVYAVAGEVRSEPEEAFYHNENDKDRITNPANIESTESDGEISLEWTPSDIGTIMEAIPVNYQLKLYESVNSDGGHSHKSDGAGEPIVLSSGLVKVTSSGDPDNFDEDQESLSKNVTFTFKNSSGEPNLLKNGTQYCISIQAFSGLEDTITGAGGLSTNSSGIEWVMNAIPHNPAFIPVKEIHKNSIPGFVTEDTQFKLGPEFIYTSAGSAGNIFADEKDIKWSLSSGSAAPTNATITEDGVLSSGGTGTIVLTATHSSAGAKQTPFTQEFKINVLDKYEGDYATSSGKKSLDFKTTFGAGVTNIGYSATLSDGMIVDGFKFDISSSGTFSSGNMSRIIFDSDGSNNGFLNLGYSDKFSSSGVIEFFASSGDYIKVTAVPYYDEDGGELVIVNSDGTISSSGRTSSGGELEFLVKQNSSGLHQIKSIDGPWVIKEIEVTSSGLIVPELENLTITSSGVPSDDDFNEDIHSDEIIVKWDTKSDGNKETYFVTLSAGGSIIEEITSSGVEGQKTYEVSFNGLDFDTEYTVSVYAENLFASSGTPLTGTIELFDYTSAPVVPTNLSVTSSGTHMDDVTLRWHFNITSSGDRGYYDDIEFVIVNSDGNTETTLSSSGQIKSDGANSDGWSWTSSGVPAGDYEFVIKVSNEKGTTSAGFAPITIAPITATNIEVTSDGDNDLIYTVKVTGTNLSDGTVLYAINSDGTDSGNITSSGSTSAGDVRTFTLEFDSHNDDHNRVFDLVVCSSGNAEESLYESDGAITVKTSKTIIDSVTADPMTFSDGDVTITVKGENLDEKTVVVISSSGSSYETSSGLTSVDTDSSGGTVTFTFNKHTDENDRVYDIAVFSDGALSDGSGTPIADPVPTFEEKLFLTHTTSILRVTNVSVDKAEIADGEVTVTVNGSNLSDGMAVAAVDSDGNIITSAGASIDANKTTGTAILTFNKHTSDGNVEYAIYVYSSGDVTLDEVYSSAGVITHLTSKPVVTNVTVSPNNLKKGGVIVTITGTNLSDGMYVEAKSDGKVSSSGTPVIGSGSDGKQTVILEFDAHTDDTDRIYDVVVYNSAGEGKKLLFTSDGAITIVSSKLRVDSISVNPNEIHKGNVVVTVNGVNLSDGMVVAAIDSDGDIVSSAGATSDGSTGTTATATLAFNAHTSDGNVVYAIAVYSSGDVALNAVYTSTGAITHLTSKPVVTGVAISGDNVKSGNVTVTITGTFLSDGMYVVTSCGEIAGSDGSTTGSSGEQTVTLTFGTHEDDTDRTYNVFVYDNSSGDKKILNSTALIVIQTSTTKLVARTVTADLTASNEYGGDVTITVGGDNLVNGMVVKAVGTNNSIETSSGTTGSSGEQTATLTFDSHEDDADRVFDVFVYSDGDMTKDPISNLTTSITILSSKTVIDSVVADVNDTNSSGGTVTVTISGKFLSDGMYVEAVNTSSNNDGNSSGETSGTETEQTVNLVFDTHEDDTDRVFNLTVYDSDGKVTVLSSGATITIKTSKTAPALEPVVTNVTANPNAFNSDGGTSIITVTGTNLSDGMIVSAFSSGAPTTAVDTSSGVLSSGNLIAELEFPVNDTDADITYTVKVSSAGGTWYDATATVIVSSSGETPVLLPVVTDVTANPNAFNSDGGTSIITVTGTNLSDGMIVSAFSSGDLTTVVDTSSGVLSGETLTATLDFPENDTDANITYLVKVSSDGSNWYDATATVTVSSSGETPVIVPVVTAVTADPDSFGSDGGISTITVTGTNLVDGMLVSAFKSDASVVTSSGVLSSGNLIAELIFPANVTDADIVYTVKVSSAGGPWYDTTATVTVSSAGEVDTNVYVNGVLFQDTAKNKVYTITQLMDNSENPNNIVLLPTQVTSTPLPTNSDIVWTVKDDGGMSVNEFGNGKFTFEESVNSSGVVTLTGTVVGGIKGGDFTEDVKVFVFPANVNLSDDKSIDFAEMMKDFAIYESLDVDDKAFFAGSDNIINYEVNGFTIKVDKTNSVVKKNPNGIFGLALGGNNSGATTVSSTKRAISFDAKAGQVLTIQYSADGSSERHLGVWESSVTATTSANAIEGKSYSANTTSGIETAIIVIPEDGTYFAGTATHNTITGGIRIYSLDLKTPAADEIIVTNVKAAPTTLQSVGGDVTVTVEGQNLAEGMKIAAFSSGDLNTPVVTSSGNSSGDDVVATLTLPENTDTDNAVSYIIKVSSSGESNEWFAKTATVTVERALKSFTLTYDANGAEGDVPNSVTVLENAEAFEVASSGNLTSSGYDFAGWNTAADSSGTNYAAGATITLTENTTLYAIWTKTPDVPVVYDLIIEKEPEAQTIFIGETASLEVTATTDSDGEINYQWYYSSTGDVDSYTVIENATSSGFEVSGYAKGTHYFYCEVTVGTITKTTTTVTVIIDEAGKATISYNLNGAEGEIAPQEVDVNTTITIAEAPARVDYSFKGWNTKADGTGDPYEAGQEVILDSSLSLYAIWAVIIPDAPVIESVTATTNSITIKWNAVVKEGSVITGYEISFDGGKTYEDIGNVSEYTKTELDSFTSYDYAVRAVTAVAKGKATSGTVMTQRELSEAKAPQDPVVRPLDGNYVLLWGAPYDNGGSDIKNYQILKDGTTIYTTSSGDVYSYVLETGEYVDTAVYTVVAENDTGLSQASTFTFEAKEPDPEPVKVWRVIKSTWFNDFADPAANAFVQEGKDKSSYSFDAALETADNNFKLHHDGNPAKEDSKLYIGKKALAYTEGQYEINVAGDAVRPRFRTGNIASVGASPVSVVEFTANPGQEIFVIGLTGSAADPRDVSIYDESGSILIDADGKPATGGQTTEIQYIVAKIPETAAEGATYYVGGGTKSVDIFYIQVSEWVEDVVETIPTQIVNAVQDEYPDFVDAVIDTETLPTEAEISQALTLTGTVNDDATKGDLVWWIVDGDENNSAGAVITYTDSSVDGENGTFEITASKAGAVTVMAAVIGGKAVENVMESFVITIGEKLFNITILEVIGGTVTTDKETAKFGETVKLTAEADLDYKFVAFEVKSDDVVIEVTDGEFTMPKGDVEVTAIFEEIVYEVTLLGDVDEDGEITVKDVIVFLKWTAGKGLEGATFNKANADVNEDGTINNNDITLIMRHLAGKIDLTV